jgi:RNA polymerase sigma factor (sigma-70 family)
MNSRIEKIKDSIPKIYFFEDSFENSSHIPKILADIKLNFDSVDHANLLNCSPILKKEQELHLFRKFNYLKYKLIKNTIGFSNSDKKPSPKTKAPVNLDRIGEKRIAELELTIDKIQNVRNILIKSNMRLIVRPISRLVDQDCFEREEFVSNGYLHVMKAVDCFDYRLGFKFSTYCMNVLKTNLYRDFVALRKNKSILLEDEKEMNNFGGNLDFSSEINSEYNKKVVQEIFEYLDENTKKIKYSEVLKLSFGIGCDKLLQKDIASKLKISRTRIQQIRDKAFDMVQHIKYDPI